MFTRLKNLARIIRTALWFRPAVWSLLAAAAVVGIASLDQKLADIGLGSRAMVEAEAVKDLLRLMAGGMLTVTTVTLSVTMVVLSLAANQASPRAVPELMADPVTQNALSTFLATFVFALAALAAFGYGAVAPAGVNLIFVAAVILGLWAVRYLVQWMHHVAQSSKLNEIISKVFDQADSSLAEYLANGDEDAVPFPELAPEDGRDLIASRAGYVQLIHVARLRETAADHGLFIRVHVREGDFVRPGLPLMTVWRDGEGGQWRDDDPRDCIAVGRERTGEGDPRLGVELLAEIACRALSPGINDPQSALVCLDYLGALLARAAAVPADRYPPASIRNGRLCLRPIEFEHLLVRALRPVMRDGAEKAEVAQKVFEVLLDLAGAAHQDYLPAIRREAARAEALAERTLVLPDDKAALAALARRIKDNARPAP